MAPFDVLVDPMSMPEHPVIEGKINTHQVVHEDSAANSDGEEVYIIYIIYTVYIIYIIYVIYIIYIMYIIYTIYTVYKYEMIIFQRYTY